MNIFTTIALILVTSQVMVARGSQASADDEERCECTVDVANRNRKVWGSWALECSGHAGHDDCPTTNIDKLHSPGDSAMTGSLVVEARSAGKVRDSWKKKFPDDHITAFKGPVWDGTSWKWTNTCSCDGFTKTKSCDGSPHSQWSDYNRAMYSGLQQDDTLVKQGRSKKLKMPGRCGNADQLLVILENIQEHDPLGSPDKLGTLAVSVRPEEGTRKHSKWDQHFEPAYDSSGKRTHAGLSGGSFGAEIVLEVSCRTT